MQTYDAAILRGAAIPVGVVAVLLMGAFGVAAGSKGVIGAIAGVLVTAAFFTASVLAVGYASRISPQAMMTMAIGTYLVKILVLFAFVVALRGTDLFAPQAFAWSVIVSTIVWVVAEVRAFGQLKIPYVTPEGHQQ